VTFALFAIVRNGEAELVELVKRILRTYTHQVNRICEASTITAKFHWQRLYGLLQESDNQKRLIEQIYKSDPESKTDWLLWFIIFEQFATYDQKRTLRTSVSLRNLNFKKSRIVYM
jgi:glycyl-tRNA synthetase beta subunit